MRAAAPRHRAHRFGQDAGDIACRQRGLQRRQVVELDHDSARDVVQAPDLARARQRAPALPHHDHRLVDGAVVAVVEHQDARPPGEGASQTQHGAIGVGGSLRELPPGQAEDLGQGLTDLGCGRGRQHGGEAARGLCGKGCRDDRR